MTGRAIRVDTADQTGEARRAVQALASALELDEETAGRAALVATECASNLWKHGGGGNVVLSASIASPGIDILALDKGDGIRDVELSFSDGYSTAGSAGGGLGAIRRMSSDLDMYTLPGKGVALLARVSKTTRTPREPQAVEAGVVSVPKPGEESNGDGFAIRREGQRATILIVDGLGHGSGAAECAEVACETFLESERRAPAEILDEIHLALRPTRGAAAAVTVIDRATRSISFAGVGNIVGSIATQTGARHITSQPGIAGHRGPTVRELAFEWPAGGVLVLFSDGISGHWSLDSYAGLVSRDPSLIAGVIYRDWNRGRDDATVLVAREGSLE